MTTVRSDNLEKMIYLLELVLSIDGYTQKVG